MSLLDAHEQELETASRDLALRPMSPPAVERKFSAWRATTAAPRGVAAGAAESAGFMSDVLGAFGQTLAATPLSNAGGMFSVPDAKAQREQDEARAKLITEGADFSSEAGDLFRGVARDYRPDAQTAHVAEDLVFGATRVISKAVGYSVLGGNPLVGAALTGADEGSQVADDLRQQGVDLPARTAAGAIQGVGTAVGVALPVAGRTLAQTAALVAAGGPGAFMAQQAATREVLQRAGYEQIGGQFDPFDPVGLAVATLVPAAFGAFALRGARKADAPPPMPPEAVDAARVSLAAEHAEGTRLTSPVDLPARAGEDAAIARAEQQLAAGERVEVDPLPVAPEVLPRLEAGALDDAAPLAPDSRAATLPGAQAMDEATALVGAARLQEMARTADDAEPAQARAQVEAVARRVVDHFERNPDALGALGDMALRIQRGAREAMAAAAKEERATTSTSKVDAVGEAAQVAPVKVGKESAAEGARDPMAPPSERVVQVSERYPDLQVQVEGMEGPVKASELLAGVKAEADQDVANAQLVAMAAECAITG